MRVVDLSHVLAGPFATYQLALMGAEVIRIERIDGDDFVRNHGGTEAMRAVGLGASFLSQNMGKKSILVDLKTPKGRDVYFRLVRTADVVCENFRPGVVDRLGVGFEATASEKADIVYASLSGFGPEGPLSSLPAYDHILQGLSGMMAMTGTPESGPMRVGFPIVDYIAGQALGSAILASLLYRERGNRRAQHIQLSMLDAIVSIMGPYAVNYATTGALRGLEGNGAFSDSPYSGRFDTSDGQLVVTANSPAQAQRLRAALAHAELTENGDALGSTRIGEILTETFASQSAEHWEAVLAEARVPAAKVRTLAEILAHPQMANSNLMHRLGIPELRLDVGVPGLPFRHSNWPGGNHGAAPTLGRDTDAVLAAVGYADGEIAEMRTERVIG